MILVLAALAFVFWVDRAAIERSHYLTALEEWSVDPPPVDASSTSGYAGTQRRLILPAPAIEGYRWIVQTEQMTAAGHARLREVASENAPLGHEIRQGTLYRWWIAAIAGLGRSVSTDRAESIELAALGSGPAVQLITLLALVGFVGWRWSRRSAVLIAGAIALWFPFAATFAPGTPGEFQLFLPLAIGSLVLFAAGLNPTPVEAAGPNCGRAVWPLLAGVVGGIGLWVSPGGEAPLLAGITIGGVLGGWLIRGQPNAGSWSAPATWRLWAAGGAATILVEYLLDRFPDRLDLRVDTAHPLHALAWLGGAELVGRIMAAMARPKLRWTKTDTLVSLLGLTAVVALPVVAVTQTTDGVMASDPAVLRLTGLFEGMAAPGLLVWAGAQAAGMIFAVVAPISVAAAGIWALARNRTPPGERIRLAVVLGPAIFALALALLQLRWWNVFDAAAIAVLAVGFAKESPERWLGWAGTVLAAIAGAVILAGTVGSKHRDLSDSEARVVVSRDLAHWLAQRTGGTGAVVVAPPDLTQTLYFYGDLRGLGTLDPENSAGLGAAVRIISAQLKMEAYELIERHDVRYLAVPSWDSYYDAYVRLGRKLPADAALPANTFIGAVRSWAPPRWLRPVPYHLPSGGKLGGYGVTVFEVTAAQDDATATSRLAEYFLEMGQPDRAEALRETLQGFRFNIAALSALAQLAVAHHDEAGFAIAVQSMVDQIGRDSHCSLAWDQRLNLAVVLTEAKRLDLAKPQLRQCVAEANETRLRELSTANLVRFLALGRLMHLELSDPKLRALAADLLPPKLRSRAERRARPITAAGTGCGSPATISRSCTVPEFRPDPPEL